MLGVDNQHRALLKFSIGKLSESEFESQGQLLLGAERMEASFMQANNHSWPITVNFNKLSVDTTKSFPGFDWLTSIS